MIKEIRYGGLSAQPNEYISEDGESALLMNLVPEKDGLQPMSKGVKGFDVDNGMKIFTHKPENKTNYIAYGNGKVQWVADEFCEVFSKPKEIFATTDEIITITSLGNVIIVSTTTAMHYARWDAQNDVYIYLGTQVPRVDIDFGLELNLARRFDEALELNLIDRDEFASGKDDWTLQAAMSVTGNAVGGEVVDGITEYAWKSNELNNVTLKVGYEYKIVIETKKSYQINTVTGDVYNSNNEIIATGFSDGKGKLTITFAPEGSDITSLYVKLRSYNIYIQSEAIALFVYQGLKSRPTNVDKEIEYTQDSFNRIVGNVNKFVNEEGTLSDKFIYPFFVRYAVKFWDNNYSYVSPPILMTPNSGYVPSISCLSIEGNSDKANLSLASWVANLQYKIASSEMQDGWKELISGIDIFVSAPIYSYNQGLEYDGKEMRFEFKDSDSNNYGIGVASEFVDFQGKHTKMNLEECLNSRFDKLEDSKLFNMEVSGFSTKEVVKKMSEIDNYYLVKTITFEELNSSDEYQTIELTQGTLQSLQARTPLEDTISKYRISNANLLTYNNRLTVFNGRRILPNPYSLRECRGTCDVLTKDSSFISEILAFAHLKTNQGERITKVVDNENGYRLLNGMGWYFYPNANAYKMTIFFKIDTTWFKGEYILKLHDYLDGAYWVGEALTSDMLESASPTTYEEVQEWENKGISNELSMLNTIYTSEAENPWTFSIGNSCRIGDGELIGVASATKAISEMQFGQFPLYAFTTDGVWALSVTDEGLFKPAQPAAMDVCKNAGSITQLDQAVLFATDRGIMMLEGANTACITDTIESELAFDLSKLKGGDKLAEMSDIKGEAFNIIPFQDFIEGCSMVYDYTHQRIILYNKACDYAYVFSLESKAWGMMEANIADKINSYPDAIVVTKDGELLNLSKESKESEDKMKGFMVSRALKLDGADVLKTIDTIVQRGDFNRGDVSTILWGSRDLKNWHLVWSSKDHYMRGFRGTPYKYYRIGALTNLGEDESLIGASINYEPKQTNNIR